MMFGALKSDGDMLVIYKEGIVSVGEQGSPSVTSQLNG